VSLGSIDRRDTGLGVLLVSWSHPVERLGGERG
jgi:hypothetical protein